MAPTLRPWDATDQYPGRSVADVLGREFDIPPIEAVLTPERDDVTRFPALVRLITNQ